MKLLQNLVYPASNPRILLGPGPCMIHPRVLEAMRLPVVGHLDQAFLRVMDDIQVQLKTLVKAPNASALTISGTGSAGMEAALANFIEPGDPILICVNGYFGERLTHMALRYGAVVHRVEAPWGRVIPPDQVESELKSRPVKLVIIVNGETSTGVHQSLHEIAMIASKYGALFAVDAVTSLGCLPIDMETIGIDILYSASQKCLAAPSGLAPLLISPKALEVLHSRKSSVANWYLDLKLLLQYWGPDRVYHHTAPISLNYAMHEALRMILEEGVSETAKRHRDSAEALWEGLEELGLNLLVEKENRIPALTTVLLPSGINEEKIRNHLLQDYNIEIAGGLGEFKGKIWRIGMMGHSARIDNVHALLKALKELL